MNLCINTGGNNPLFFLCALLTIVKRKTLFSLNRGSVVLGRKRKPDYLKKGNLILRLPNPVIWELEKKGNASREAERMILDLVKVNMDDYITEEEK